ncbi:MAG: Crp/Fnr family transcriptional regulator [Calditrichaeota bacterium]|nr:Crp/Fnr family transcriptional regulator [Calditrichota bacterium]
MDYSVLEQFNLFEDINDDDLKVIYKVCNTQVYSRDNMILIEEEFGNTLFLINKGKVKISRISDDGREVILSILSDGDFFGEMSIIDGMTRSANVVTLAETELIILSREDFLRLIYQFPQLAINLLKELTARLRRSDQHIKSLSLQDAVGKVASALLRLAENSGTIKNGRVQITNVPAQQDLANMAGTSRETISRAIKILYTDDYILKEGSTIIIKDYELFKATFS